ncbi:MAG TPA: fibronectin type III domain-containing protein [Thermodesulfovibrionales bacterium]|nr:fibronectin type III domain-containing protein [Thermodesulfovibrionales bacterium]
MKIRNKDTAGLAKIKGRRLNIFLLSLGAVISLGLLSFFSPASAMPVPTSGQYVLSYNATASPITISDPSLARPLALGSVSTAGDKLSIQVGLEQFDAPVDIYFAIYAPKIDPNNVYLLTAGNSIQAVSVQAVAQGIIPWKVSVNGPVSEAAFPDIPVSALPPGPYYFGIVVTPPGSFNTYDLWVTQINLPSLTVDSHGQGSVMSKDGIINCGSSCTGTYAPGASVTLTASDGLLKWSSACDVVDGNTCIVAMNKNKTVSPTFGMPLQIKPNVKVINENIAQCMTVLDGTYSFTLSNCPDAATFLSNISPGDVLDVTVAPTSIANVTSVNKSGGVITAQTTAGTLADMLPSGTKIAYSTKLNPSGSTSSAAALAMRDQSRSAQATTCSGDFCFYLDGPNSGAQVQGTNKTGYQIEGGLTFSPSNSNGDLSIIVKDTNIFDLDLDGDVSTAWCLPFFVDDLWASLSAFEYNQLTVDGHGKYKSPGNQEVDLGKIPFPTFSVGPVVISSGLAFKAGINADINGQFHAGVSGLVSLDNIGFRCNPCDFSCHTTGSGQAEKRTDPTTFSGSTDITGYLKPTFQMDVYGLVGGDASLYPDVELKAAVNSTNDTADFSVWLGLNAGAGVHILADTWKKEWTWNLDNWCLIGTKSQDNCFEQINNGNPVTLGPTASITTNADGVGGSFTTTSTPVIAYGSASDANGVITDCTWDFGDGTGPISATYNPADSQCPEGGQPHTYTADGPYTITFTVTDNLGKTASATKQMTVNSQPVPPPTSVKVTRGTSPSSVVVSWTPPDVCALSSNVPKCYGQYKHGPPLAEPPDVYFNIRRTSWEPGNGQGDQSDIFWPAIDATGYVTDSSNSMTDRFHGDEGVVCYQVAVSRGSTIWSSFYPTKDSPSDPANSACIVSTSPPVTATPSFISQATSIIVSWDEIGDKHMSYQVFRDGKLVKTLLSPPFYDTGLVPGKTYNYKVGVLRSGAPTPIHTSTEVSMTTSSDTTPPTTPSGVAASVKSDSEIDLQWSPSTDNVGVAGYRVYTSSATGLSYLTSVPGTTLQIPGLSAGQTYCYRVSAVDAAGNESAKSTQACATTQGGSDTQPPTVPTGLTATAVSSSQINLTWNASTDNVGVTGYNIYGNGSSTALKTLSGTSTSEIGLNASTQYCYQVSAVDAAGNESAKSTQACATTQNVPTYSISGQVTYYLTDAGQAGITITLSHPFWIPRTIVTDSNGNYTFTGLPSGTYTISPTTSGYTFSPPSSTIAINGADVKGINFVATPIIY